MSLFSNNLETIRSHIKYAAQEAARDPSVIKLIAVSKGQDEVAIQDALSVGQRLFGENRVQEAKRKFGPLKEAYPDLELHLIGPLQTNKVQEAVKLFDVIETLDRPSLADALTAAIKKIGRTPKLYIEVNIDQEEQKTGIAPDQLDRFLSYCRNQCGLRPEGLMCIPPLHKPPLEFFRKMQELARQYQLSHLSMGMSADYQEAVRWGATEVRVGTALFGPRVHKTEH